MNRRQSKLFDEACGKIAVLPKPEHQRVMSKLYQDLTEDDSTIVEEPGSTSTIKGKFWSEISNSNFSATENRVDRIIDGAFSADNSAEMAELVNRMLRQVQGLNNSTLKFWKVSLNL